MLEVREYLDGHGFSPFAAWSDRLNQEAAAKVAAALARMQQGNLSNTKGVGSGAFEYRVDFGPGYRIYFGKDGDGSSSYSAAARKSASSRTSPPRWFDGTTTNDGKRKKGEWVRWL